ncbi:DUF4142 domain-containing protein [Streptomyces sp. NPDC057877]|uniref:DUF4142 domain-containing protein n=1 Tax=Streptomyces sp. NPDC057877 TaxID=3346269 RepID=UPI0036B412CD
MRIRLAVGALVVALSGISAPQAFADGGGVEDEMLMMKARQANLAEIAAGKDAQKNAASDCVRKAGAVMARDHAKLGNDLKAMAGKLGVTLPGAPAQEHTRALTAVRAKAGTPAYDTEWLKGQDAALRRTLALIDLALQADVARSTEFAATVRAVRPIVEMHLDLVRGGTCHPARDAGTIRAGEAGRLSPTDSPSTSVRVLTMAGGGLLAAGGIGLLLRHRRRADQH